MVTRMLRRIDQHPSTWPGRAGTRPTKRRLRALALVACILLPQACRGPEPAPDTGTRLEQASVQVAHQLEAPVSRGAVACVERHAAAVGADILARGGNAVDATVATAFALAVTWPSAGNIAGGGLMVVRMADGTEVVIDYRETAPAAMTSEHFLDLEGRYDGDRALDPWACVGVPGSVRGLALAHERFGRLPWAELLEPAIGLARDGFETDEIFHRFLTDAAGQLAAVPASRKQFLDAAGRVPPVGSRLVQTDLANTLQTLADEGPDALYEGPLAHYIADTIQAGGGLLSAEDLAAYAPIVREPLRVPFAGHTLLAAPPPCSGGIAAGQILGMAERVALADEPRLSVAGLHLYAEAARRAFAERARWLGDPQGAMVPVGWLLAPRTLDDLAASIDPAAATRSARLGPPVHLPEPEHTTHISVVDGSGNAVSNTTTLEGSFGSRAVVAGTGILLNNQLRDFNRIPGTSTENGHIGTPANRADPGRRPLTSMTPVIVLRDDGAPVLLTGSPGGRTIINTVAQVTLDVIGRRETLVDAVHAPRVHHQWFPDQLRLEASGFPDAIRAGLEALGHDVVELAATPPLEGTLGAAHSIALDWDAGVLTAVGDPRRDGWAASPRPLGRTTDD